MFRKYGKVYYYRNAYEIDVVVDGLRVEVKAGNLIGDTRKMFR